MGRTNVRYSPGTSLGLWGQIWLYLARPVLEVLDASRSNPTAAVFRAKTENSVEQGPSFQLASFENNTNEREFPMFLEFIDIL